MWFSVKQNADRPSEGGEARHPDEVHIITVVDERGVVMNRNAAIVHRNEEDEGEVLLLPEPIVHPAKGALLHGGDRPSNDDRRRRPSHARIGVHEAREKPV